VDPEDTRIYNLFSDDLFGPAAWPPPVPVDYLADVLNAGFLTTPPADPITQRMISTIDDLEPIVVLSGNRPSDGPSALARAARGLWSLLNGGRRSASRALVSGTSVIRAGDVWLEPLAAGTTEPRQERDGMPAIRMFVTSLGTSTGEAFQVHIVNDGPRPVRLAGGSLVLEPIGRAAQAEVRRQVAQAISTRNTASLRMSAYCLEFTRQPPSKDMIFRVAGRELQERFAPMRSILDAAKKLQAAGLLKPDSDPMAYFHAIRQWSIWTKEQGFDVKAFGRAFVERTKQNLKELGQKWTSEIEQAVQARVPGRWRDIQQVLAEAERISRDADAGVGGR
jgi:hypothetical protein